MASIASLPAEIFIDELFPVLPLRDLLSLACTNRFFANLANDDTFWRKKVMADYKFFSQRSTRKTGFKLIYKSVRRPKVFVWGNTNGGILGLHPEILAKQTLFHGGIPQPIELKVGTGDAGIIGLSAGSRSFMALDSKGRLFVWGRLESSFAQESDGFAKGTKSAPTPLRLDLPVRITSMSCGENFSLALDSSHQIWQFRNWGRPHRIVTPLFNGSCTADTVCQVEAGITFASALTKAGEVYVWAYGPEIRRLIYRNNLVMDSQGEETQGHEENGVIKCATWDMHFSPLALPQLPNTLPLLQKGGSKDYNLVKIAAGHQFIIGLTSGGHVLKFDLDIINREPDGLDRLRMMFDQGERTWQYLKLFSDINHVRKCQGFDVGAPITMEITHISAAFHAFVAYSSSIVLVGSSDADALRPPTIFPTLQSRSVIGIVFGDHHQAALTSDGQLLTQGGYSNGALGLGNPFKIEPGQPGGFRDAQDFEKAQKNPWRMRPAIASIPTPIRFDWYLKKKKERFVVAATAFGTHAGALVVDLDGQDEEEGKVPAQDDGIWNKLKTLHRINPVRVGFMGIGARRVDVDDTSDGSLHGSIG